MRRNLRISFKIYIFTYIIVMLFAAAAGFLFVNSTYKNDLDTAGKQALADNRTLYIYVMTMNAMPDSLYMEYSLIGLRQKMSENDTDMKTVVGSFDEWKSQIAIDGISELNDAQVVSGVVEKSGRKAVQVTSRCGNKYIINYKDIDDIIKRRDYSYDVYNRTIIIASVLLAVILYIFSWYITRPLVKVTKAAERISGGDYSVRIDTRRSRMKSYEVEVLADTLNEMAENTQKYIDRLIEENRKKEDFMGNFTHELKTPMTSIIGYSDLIRTYDLDAKRRREYADYIYREAKRLEQLSLNLLQLLVMGNVEFEMSEVRMSEFAKQINENIRFLAKKYGTVFETDLDDADVLAETSLLSTLVLNLCDNACKASDRGGVIRVTGGMQSDRYVICVQDFGKGIPCDELHRVTEAFYMVDKSRARKQGGAGLGLALCKKIAEVHESELDIRSEEGLGTKISIMLKPAAQNKCNKPGVSGYFS